MLNFDFVRVPVLSNTTQLHFAKLSITLASLKIIPPRIALLNAIKVATGVARLKAHGQAMIITLIATIIAVLICSELNSHTPNVPSPKSKIAKENLAEI